MKRNRRWLVLLIIVAFVGVDIWNGNTYHFMNVESMLYLAAFILLIAGVLLLNQDNYEKFLKLFMGIIGGFVLVFLIGGLMSSRIINAKKYAGVIGDVEEVEFNDLYGKEHEVEMSYVDKNSALLAAEKTIGELSEVSARFSINESEFSQINYQNEMVRVAPFQYTDPIKQYLNFNKGIPYYVRVLTGAGKTNAKAEIVTLDEPMKYYPGAPLNYSLKRHVAFKHKFTYIDDYHFEIDEDGHPFWVVQGITKKVGLWGAKDVSSVITVDAVSGKTQRYKVDEAPDWVDYIYPSKMLLSRAKDHYTLSGGYLNSIIQEQGVKEIDQEIGTYNYVSIDDEMYVFTGVRPVSLDEASTTGLLFMSTKTGEAITLNIPGISLKTAQSTSIGSIQEKNYEPTTPVLQNIGSYPTYVMSLKDQSGVIRGFSLVDYQDYTKSSVGLNLKEAEKKYLALHIDDEGLIPEEKVEMDVTIKDIKQVLVDGETVYYLRFKEEDGVFRVALNVEEKLPFYQENQKLIVEVSEYQITDVLKDDLD